MKRTLQDRALIGFGIHYWYDEQVRQFSAITMADRDPARPAFGYDGQRVCSRTMGVSSLMNDIELACLLLPRGKG